MDGNTPIDVFAPQFSQREASEVADAPMPAINNWLKRGAFKFSLQSQNAEPEDGSPRRRFFSIADIARLHVMRFCTEHLEISPEAAAVAAQGVLEYFAGEMKEIAREDGTQFEVWHWAHRTYDFQGGARYWRIQGVWQDRATGAFYQYHPGLFADEEPAGPPHFPCVCIPTSQLARRIFLACADRLMAEREGDEAPRHRREADDNLNAGGSAPGQTEEQ
jgi:hypothetical protein